MAEQPQTTFESPAATIKRHAEYYIPDGNVVFLVENVLFRVHKYFLTREPSAFCDMFAVGGEASDRETRKLSESEGLVDERPINLYDYKSDQFADFLWMFYHRRYNKTATAERWLSILESADRWQMQEIRTTAIEELSRFTVDPFVKLQACHRYDIDLSWALDAFVHVCTREAKMSQKEGLMMGGRNLVIVANAQEELANQKRSTKLDFSMMRCNSCGYQGGNNGCSRCRHLIAIDSSTAKLNVEGMEAAAKKVILSTMKNLD